jgi:hypothetical protein
MSSVVPSGRVLSIDGDGGTPGVVGYGVDLGTGNGNISSTDWLARQEYPGTAFGFQYFLSKFRINTEADPFDGSMAGLASGEYYSGSDLSINGAFPAGEKIVVFVDGNVTVEGDLIVPSGSFLAIISSGEITFSDTVDQAQGFFMADGTITVAGGSSQFFGEGSFVSRINLDFNRDLSSSANATTPSEMFIERPDFYINAPASFKITSSYFREIEP